MPLLNGFVDSIACVGFQSEFGLATERQVEDNVNPILSYLQPYVLAILTADYGIYPETKGKFTVDPSYPFITPIKSPPTTNSKILKKQSVNNMINNLSIFCSLDGVKLSPLPIETRIHHVVFTQEDGKHSYAVVLTLKEKFLLKNETPDADGNYQIESVPIYTTPAAKKGSRARPSAYRHTTGNALGNMQVAHSSSNLRRGHYGSSTSLDTDGRNPDAPEPLTRKNSTSNLANQSRMFSGSNLSLSSKLSRSTTSLVFDTSEPFYVPHFLVLTSSHPYWTAMHELISRIYHEICREKIELYSDTYKELIRKYAFFACYTPIPPIAWDRLSFSFNLTNDRSFLTLDPPIHTNRTVLDLDLSILLLTLNIGKLIDTVSAILTQQPIVFFSTDYSKLVTSLECLIYLIYPLKWIHTYIPIVPHSLRDYCLQGPPGSYIMGLNSRYQAYAEEMDASFLCNLDDDKPIHILEDMEFVRIPPGKLRRFTGPITTFVEKLKVERSIEKINQPTSFRMNEKSEDERQQRLKTNNRILEIFLDLMVDLCDDALKPIYWKVEHQQTSPSNTLQRERKNSTINKPTTFSKEKFLLSKPEGPERDFYRVFISTTAFELFIEDEKNATTPTEFRKICQLHSQVYNDQPNHFSTLSSTSTKRTQSLIEIPITVSLPDWPLDVSIHYLDLCIDAFTQELEQAQQERSSPSINIYAYLRGCAFIARGEYLKGLEDFYLIGNANLFPKTYIQTTVVPLLSELNLLEKFEKQKFYQTSSEWKKLGEEELNETRRISMIATENTLLPTFQGDLTFDQFHDYVQRSSIVNTKELAEILFHALSHWIVKTSDGGKAGGGGGRRRWSITGNAQKDSSTPAPLTAKASQAVYISSDAVIPSKFFELFLETWQRTNADKERMLCFLPKDRQNQESILMISSYEIQSKNNIRGKLILTQRGIYLLPNGNQSAQLVCDLLNIVKVDSCAYRTIFSSSKPAIQIFGLKSSCSTNTAAPTSDSEPLDMLLFRDSNDRNFWHKILEELRAGTFIAQAEYDTSVLSSLSRNIALIDTLVNIDINDLKNDKKMKLENHQACVDSAIYGLSIFTRMETNGTFKRLTAETLKALSDRFSLSIDEDERHSVRCLVLTGHRESNNHLLWCAYGNKLKIFNTKTWICDPNVLSFSSDIVCMCLDSSNKLWIGCIDGRVFLVDTIQRICGTQLALVDGIHGCQSMAFDNLRNQMLIANQESQIQIWNTITKQFVTKVNINEMYENNKKIKKKIQDAEMVSKFGNQMQNPNIPTFNAPVDNTPQTPNLLQSIEIHGDLLFARYRDDYVLILSMDNSNSFIYDQSISIKYKNSSIPIDSILIYNQQLWICAGYIISIYDIHKQSKKTTFDLAMRKHFEGDQILTMLGMTNYVWAGSSCGNIYIFRMDNYELFETFNGHKDGVCCFCPMFDTQVISGSKKNDTSIIIWKNIDTGNFIENTRL